MSSPPVWDRDFPDPFVLRVGEDYWAFATNADGRNVQVLHSSDLARWTATGEGLPRLPNWATPGRTWSPVVLDLAGTGTQPPADRRFVLYVAVRHAETNRQAIMTATAPDPAGPYQPAGAGPLVFQIWEGGSIDPSPFVDRDRAAYLVWKADANALRHPSSLWGQQLAAGGTELVGQPVELLRVDRAWEQPLIEAPCLVRHDDRYYLFYSAGRWNSDGYGVGYAVADAPLGPWHKLTTDGPWFGSDHGVSGPGGQELFVGPGGEWRMAYHGWDPRHVTYRAGGHRSLHLARVTFADGQPRLDEPAAAK